MRLAQRYGPPDSNTGVQTPGVSVGWLRGSVVAPDEERHSNRVVDRLRILCGGTAERWYGNRAYGTGVRASDWSWLVGREGKGDAAGTVMIEIRQSVFEAHEDRAVHLAAGLIADGLRPSRVDLAGDALHPTRRAVDYFRAWDGAVSRVRASGVVLMVKRSGEQTLMVGARGGERFLRIYDKPERGGVRHELEIKGDRARSLAVALGVVPLAQLFAEQYGSFVRWP